MTPKYEALPDYLRTHARFCCWRYEDRDGKRTKVPYNPRTGVRAQVDNQNTFTDFGSAVAAAAHYDGIGLGVFNNVAGIDIDHCVEDGKLSEMAQDIVNTMDCYTELSPSGTGIHIYCGAPGFSFDTDKYYINYRDIGLEVYVAGQTNRFLTVTGTALRKAHIADRSEQLQVILDKYMIRPQPKKAEARPPQPVGMDDRELINRAKDAKNGDKFSRLWAGDWSDYESQSNGDQALCNMLAFWTGRDAARMDNLFRSSGLMRSKWDERRGSRTYGQMTIQEAISQCAEVYTPSEGRALTWDDVTAEESTKSQEKPAEERKVPKTTTATELLAMDLPPVQWIVRDLLPVGSSAIVAASKIGKSWMVLDILLTVAMGGNYMGHSCPQCGVLYLALEDSNNRLQSRMKKVLDGRPAPPDFHYATEWETLDSSFYSDLDTWLKDHPTVKIVAVDVLQRVRGAVRSKESSYGADYREIGGLKRFFDARGLSLILVHHTRKNTQSDDPYDTISGTNGIMGALDAVWVILKDRREDDHATLHIIGRDVEQQELTVRFNKDNGRWENLGSADWFAEERKRQEHEQNPIVVTLKKLLSENGRWRGSTSDLMREVLHKTKYAASNPVRFGKDVKALVPALAEYDGIMYEPVKNGTGPATHVFYWPGTDDSEELEQTEI